MGHCSCLYWSLVLAIHYSLVLHHHHHPLVAANGTMDVCLSYAEVCHRCELVIPVTRPATNFDMHYACGFFTQTAFLSWYQADVTWLSRGTTSIPFTQILYEYSRLVATEEADTLSLCVMLYQYTASIMRLLFCTAIHFTVWWYLSTISFSDGFYMQCGWNQTLHSSINCLSCWLQKAVSLSVRISTDAPCLKNSDSTIAGLCVQRLPRLKTIRGHDWSESKSGDYCSMWCSCQASSKVHAHWTIKRPNLMFNWPLIISLEDLSVISRGFLADSWNVLFTSEVFLLALSFVLGVFFLPLTSFTVCNANYDHLFFPEFLLLFIWLWMYSHCSFWYVLILFGFF